MQALNISLMQLDLAWQNPSANREAAARHLAELPGDIDVVVLPEMWTTGFTMAPVEVAESADGPTLAWMTAMAARHDCVITGSVAVAEGGHFFNRLYWVSPDGAVQCYDKRHLFRMAAEHEHYRAGQTPLLVEWRGWRICPLICYDLRFPVWSRRRPALEYDLLLYVANWPAARRNAWQTLLRARAIENQCYCVGVNRVGVDGQQLSYAGDSAVIDFVGQTCVELHAEPGLVTFSLDGSALHHYRQHFPAHLDADRFDVL